MPRNAIAAVLGALAVASAPALAVADDAGLLGAVLKSDHASLRSLLEKKADPNARRPDGSTPLHWAVDRQDAESVRLLLAAKADPNAADRDGATPLALACQLGGADIVGQLVGAGAKPDVPRFDGIAPLALCARSSTPEALERLVAAGADVNAASPEGQTPAMWAAAGGKTANIAFLAQRGADMNRASKGGFTPLFFAVQSGVAGAAEAVIQAGGDPNYVSPEGVTALQLALLEEDFSLAALLVGKGVDVNRWDINGNQPLHVAAAKNNDAFAKLLLDKGADPNALTRQAYRVIDVDGKPVEQGNGWPVEDPNVKVINRQRPGTGMPPSPPPAQTPLMVAAENGSLATMKLLAGAGAKADFKAKDGSNLAMAAVNSGDPEVVGYALELNPDLTAVDGAGQTLMHLAVAGAEGEKGEALIRLLAERGAALDAKNARGQTPGTLANRRPENIKALYASLLKERGVAQAALPARR